MWGWAMIGAVASGAEYYDHPEFYDLEGERGGPDQADVRFFLDYARRAGRALELGAATGTYTGSTTKAKSR